MSDIKATREAWLHAAVEIFRPRFEEIGMPLPEKLHLSVGFSARGRSAENSAILGVCYATFVSEDAVNHIFITPEVDDTAEVLSTLLHELIHAADDCINGHTGAFAEAATRLGFEGPMTSTPVGLELATELFTIAEVLGEYPHGRFKAEVLNRPTAPVLTIEPTDELDPIIRKASSGPKAQTNRHALVKCQTNDCPCGGYQVRTSAKWIAIGFPFCPIGNQMELI